MNDEAVERFWYTEQGFSFIVMAGDDTDNDDDGGRGGGGWCERVEDGD